ncbi:MAG: hypothetical protein OXT69_08300 [Candidatus Poribacteria bacterium]|nr:hypothetical protein [Candidatus Poribacteria bacterium]
MTRRALETLRAPSVQAHASYAVLCAVSLALGLGLQLDARLHFEYRSAHGVIGWVSVNEYAKSQETLYYLLAVFGIPLFVALCLFACALFSRWMSRQTGQPEEWTFQRCAFALTPLLLACFFFKTAVGLALLLALGVYVAGRALPSKPPPEAPPADFAPQPKKSAPKTPAWKTARLLLIYVLIPALLYLLYYSGGIDGGIDLFHEGERLAPLNEMLRGGVPYRDIYIQHGLFENAFLARVGAALFGETLAGVRLMQRLLGPIGYIALYILGVQLYRGSWASALILLMIASGHHTGVSARHTFGLLCAAMSVSALQQDEAGRLWKIGASGLCAGFAFWHSAEIGMYSICAVGLFWGIRLLTKAEPKGERLRPVLFFSAGVVVGLAPAALWLLRHGALDDAVRNAYIQLAYQLDTWGLPFSPLERVFQPFEQHGLLGGWKEFIGSERLRWYLPPAALVAAGAVLVRRAVQGDFWKNEACAKGLLTALCLAAFFRTALGRSDGGHLIFGSTFFWPLLLLPLDRAAAGVWDALRAKRKLTAMQWAWAALPILIAALYAARVHRPVAAFQSRWNWTLHNQFNLPRAEEELERAGPINIPDDQVQQIQAVVKFIQENTAPDERIFDFSSQGAYYFFADRPAATRYHQICYASAPELEREVIDALEKDQTRLVLYKTGGWFDTVDGIDSELRHPQIARYLYDNYEEYININGARVWMRIKGMNSAHPPY